MGKYLRIFYANIIFFCPKSNNQLKLENQDWQPEKLGLKAKINLNRDELNLLAQKVLQELRLGKQASSYKLVQKSLTQILHQYKKTE